MRTITLSVDDQLAKKLSKMKQREIDGLMQLLKSALDDRRSLEEIIHDMQRQAKRAGLTQKKLDAILKELE